MKRKPRFSKKPGDVIKVTKLKNGRVVDWFCDIAENVPSMLFYRSIAKAGEEYRFYNETNGKISAFKAIRRHNACDDSDCYTVNC